MPTRILVTLDWEDIAVATGIPVRFLKPPQLSRPPACIGCINYYGKDNIVCGIHPYGAVGEEEICADWEGESDNN